MQRPVSIVVAGAFGIDTNVYAASGAEGAETAFAGVTDGLGQAGCYSALASAALGVRTGAIAALGDDRAGTWVRNGLRAADVVVTELRDPGGTHRSVNLVGADGSRRNFFDAKGVSDVVVDMEACRAALHGAQLLHCHLDDWSRRLLPLAREAGLIVSCDLQDVLDIDDPYRADFVAAADILFMSASNLRDPTAAALDLSGRRDGRVVVVGAGAAGCQVVCDGRVRRFDALDLDEPIVDTNGAGDNLAMGFLVARIIDRLPLERVVRRAQLGARWICTQRGDEKAPLARAQLDRLEAELPPG
jgi:sugar/nucleoside kinase (ribokinase family)